jgi:hypothetical protein
MLKIIRFYFLAINILFMAISSATANAQVPNKTIAIYNNSNETIYPVLETPIIGVDLWLQAEFATTNTAQDLYPHTEIYRVYINPSGGVAPNSSVIINVPFYSQLVSNPSPSLNNQYINWWNGARIYIYDDQTALTIAYNQDQSNLISPITPGVSCQSSSYEPLNIFSSTVGLPLNDPYQLTEYTFANINTQTVPYQISTNYVDYDISYVDHAYLPVAIEPYGNNSVGYTGTVNNVTSFRSILNQFAMNTRWPQYVQTPQYPNIRLPGAYNLFIGADIAPQNSLPEQNMQSLWTNCTSNSDNNSALCQNINIVADLFNENYTNYLNYPCSSHLPLTLILMLQHVYGWVPFNECPSGGIDNALYNTPGANYNQAATAYKALQYSYLTNPGNPFNPYVELIHGQNYLNMDAYAYSIDDAVGNINTEGSGMIIAIGGSTGLPNQNPYNSSTPINVNLGAPSSSGPFWSSYGIGTATPNIPLNGQLGFQVTTTSFPCEISLQDSAGNLYYFTIPHGAPLSTSDINCAAGDTWCQDIIVDPNTQKDINTPPPS